MVERASWWERWRRRLRWPPWLRPSGGAQALPPPRGARPVALEGPRTDPKTRYEQIRERGRHITYRGEVVASDPERRIANFLHRKGVAYVYEMRIEGATPDFYLPDSNILIEHWGMDTRKYKEHRMRKTRLYQSRGYVLVETEKKDVPRLERVLEARLLQADPHVFERGEGGRRRRKP